MRKVGATPRDSMQEDSQWLWRQEPVEQVLGGLQRDGENHTCCKGEQVVQKKDREISGDVSCETRCRTIVLEVHMTVAKASGGRDRH